MGISSKVKSRFKEGLMVLSGFNSNLGYWTSAKSVNKCQLTGRVVKDTLVTYFRDHE